MASANRAHQRDFLKAIASRGKPVAEKCPECGASYLVEKWLKAGPVLQCVQCKYKKDMPPPVANPEPAEVTVPS